MGFFLRSAKCILNMGIRKCFKYVDYLYWVLRPSSHAIWGSNLWLLFEVMSPPYICRLQTAFDRQVIYQTRLPGTLYPPCRPRTLLGDSESGRLDRSVTWNHLWWVISIRNLSRPRQWLALSTTWPTARISRISVEIFWFVPAIPFF